MTLLHQVVRIALPVITFFLITLVGMDTTIQAFRQVVRKPKALIVGVLGQYILPLIALSLLKPLHLNPEIGAGLMVIACAPAGGISNVYTYLARANTALSVTLTSLSCAAAVVTMPLLLHEFERVSGYRSRFQIPLKALFVHLVLLLVLPVLCGIWIRHRRAAFVKRWESTLRASGFLSLFLLLAFIVYQASDLFVRHFQNLVAAAAVFILLSMLGGYLLGQVFRLQRQDRFTLVSELGVRNVAISTTVAVTVLSRPEFAVFGTAYFLIEVPILLAVVGLYRKRSSLLSRLTGA